MPHKDPAVRKQYRIQYYLRNKAAFIAGAKLRATKDPGRNYRDRLKRVYGITEEEYNLRLEEQGGKCAICRQPATNFKVRLAVDHNHKTERIRGLLCGNCNHILGKCKDSLDVIQNAYCYLLTDAAVNGELILEKDLD